MSDFVRTLSRSTSRGTSLKDRAKLAQRRGQGSSAAGRNMDRKARRVARQERRKRFKNAYAGLPVKDMGDIASYSSLSSSSGVQEITESRWTVKVSFASVQAMEDTNGDGIKDFVAIDTTGDGKADKVGHAVDTVGDGVADSLALDTTGDGRADTYVKIVLGTKSGGEFRASLKQTGPNELTMFVLAQREKLTLDMLVDAVESWGDDEVERQAANQSSVSDADFEVTDVIIGGHVRGVRKVEGVDTTGDGKADHDAETWMMPLGSSNFGLSLYQASDKLVIKAVSKYIVGLPQNLQRADGGACCVLM